MTSQSYKNWLNPASEIEIPRTTLRDHQLYRSLNDETGNVLALNQENLDVLLV